MNSVISFRPSFLTWLRCSILLAFSIPTWVQAASPLPSPPSPSANRLGHVYFRFPVSWEMLRSGFNTLDVALESENYAEYWAILYLSPDEIELISPHGRTHVVGIHSELENTSGYPDTLVISEAEFGRLLGLETDPSNNLEKLIFLDLPISESKEQSIVLKANLKYFVSIQFTMNF